jgi:rhamnosyl/mannosyltransferase
MAMRRAAFEIAGKTAQAAGAEFHVVGHCGVRSRVNGRDIASLRLRVKLAKLPVDFRRPAMERADTGCDRTFAICRRGGRAMTLRILHFYRTYHPDSFGGTERVIHAIATAAKPLGVESTVLSLSRDPARNSVDFDGHRAEKARLDLEIASNGMSLSAFGRFRELARRADLIHFHYPWPFMDLVSLATRHAKPYIVTHQSDIVRQRLMRLAILPLERPFLAGAARIVATSPQYLRTSANLRRHADKTVVIPIGLHDRSGTLEAARVERWRRELPASFFLFVGQLRHYKGFDVLEQAAARSGLPAVAIGGGDFAAVSRGGVRLLGDLPDADKHAILSLCTALVLPSVNRAEAYGLVLVEASMFGKPMITCEVGTGTSFVNRDGETGFVVPARDVEAVAGAMRRLHDDAALARRMGQAARQRYLSELTAAKMAQGYLTLYRDVIGDRA